MLCVDFLPQLPPPGLGCCCRLVRAIRCCWNIAMCFTSVLVSGAEPALLVGVSLFSFLLSHSLLLVLFTAQHNMPLFTATPFRLRRNCIHLQYTSDSVRFVFPVPARRRCCVWASSRAPGGCPGASVSVVCALRGSLSGPRWVPCRCVCGWCLGGTGCGAV